MGTTFVAPAHPMLAHACASQRALGKLLEAGRFKLLALLMGDESELRARVPVHSALPFRRARQGVGI